MLLLYVCDLSPSNFETYYVANAFLGPETDGDCSGFIQNSGLLCELLVETFRIMCLMITKD